jgi:hypothetical protein
MYIAGSMSSARCVGDDGLAIVPGVDVEGFVDGINNLGEVAQEKTEYWEPVEMPRGDWRQEAWHYTKRPIYRVQDTFIQGNLFIFPSLEYLLNLSDQYHRSATMGMSTFERKRRAIRQFVRLWSDIASRFNTISDMALDILVEFGRLFYIHLSLPFAGGILFPEHHAYGSNLIVPPRPDRSMWKEDPFQVELENLRGKSIVVPAWRGQDDRIPDVGQMFESRSSVVLSVLTSLKVIERRELIREEVHLEFGSDARSLFYLRGEYSFSWNYIVLEDPPFWTYQ